MRISREEGGKGCVHEDQQGGREERGVYMRISREGGREGGREGEREGGGVCMRISREGGEEGVCA